MIELNRREILKYSFLPQIVPRVKEIVGHGFYHVAYFIALVYAAVRLLPANHPYVSGANIGRFGVRQVIAEAANYIVFDRRHLDQIFLFFLVLFGLAIACVQVILLGGSLFMQSAMAAGFSDFFVTPDPTNDLAFMFMDMVFGVPGVFDSCVVYTTSDWTDCVAANDSALVSLTALAENGFPYPIHHALHEMLRLYSTGLMVVAILVTSYFVFTVVAETAQTGTPFGKRFNKVWAPLRIVAAFALLMPLGYGLNSAQYIVLNMAKFGSSFATNGWMTFNDTLQEQMEDEYTKFVSGQQQLVARPQSPSSSVANFLQFLFVARVCQEIENKHSGAEDTTGEPEVHPYLVRNIRDTSLTTNMLLEVDSDDMPVVDYETMYDFINGGSGEGNADTYGVQFATVVFGKAGARKADGTLENNERYGQYEGGVEPTCGVLRFNLTDARKPYDDESGHDIAEPGIDLVQRYYWHQFHQIYFTINYFFSWDGDGGYNTAEELAKRYYLDQTDAHYPVSYSEDTNEINFPRVGYNFFSDELKYILSIGCEEDAGYDSTYDLFDSCGSLENFFFYEDRDPMYSMTEWQSRSESWQLDEDFRNKGWAAAGIWYNKIAEMNGAVMEAAMNLPQSIRYPLLMEEVLRQKTENNQYVNMEERFNPTNLANGQSVNLKDGDEDAFKKAGTLWIAYSVWNAVGTDIYNQPTGNAFIDTIKSIFGTEGLYNLQYNKDTHPLAQLIAVGKSLVDSSIRNIGYAAIGQGAKLLNPSLTSSLGVDAATGFIMSVTMIALTIGFVLYYVVPFLPFIYFFFAVGGWVKGIFEALVGVPLWALAHIRIDGNGLPGQAALSGYFLIFEIFIRPLLTVFGLLASISIFAALVGVLGDIWVMVASNVGGFDLRTSLSGVYLSGQQETEGALAFMRSSIDQFFYTIVYAIVVYMIGMSSFKLIDMIPNNILRWMGQSVSAFNDTRENPAEAMIGRSHFGAQEVTSKLGSVVGAK